MSDDIDFLLAQEASELTRDEEISRVLNAFPLDAYSVLDLRPGCTPSVIKKQYRKKSLLIHPDKSKNVQAPEAFDRLKKAEALLQDDKAREVLDQAFTDARKLLIMEKKWTYDDERLKSDEFYEEWRQKTKDVLIENELRKRRLQKLKMEEEGRLKRQMEEAAAERRMKRESEQAWEDTRDTRVGNWRDYRNKVTKQQKKKKTKLNVLG
ncbi:Chaperone protein dnaJ [Sugiyamaella lignohabitans]|uniref:Chaperone protein dnaJ n=1 Tax=Sugiyamaella lignohabitans TaxID=796027 RepID=A0A161HMW6_9ASCO|nr:Chaperone protein dnaJ [Sugiyamaella lignohabitans]ANB15327.1 Chaperone protein dnaJ [Sugiyamaella lignohabitans]